MNAYIAINLLAFEGIMASAFFCCNKHITMPLERKQVQFAQLENIQNVDHAAV